MLIEQVLVMLAVLNLSADHPEKAVVHARRAIELAPSHAAGHAFLAAGLARSGQPAAALQSLRKSFRLDPRLGWNAGFGGSIRAGILRQAGRCKEAIALWEQTQETNPDLVLPRLELVNHYVGEGRLDEAGVLVEEVLRVNPEFTVAIAQFTMKGFIRLYPFLSVFIRVPKVYSLPLPRS